MTLFSFPILVADDNVRDQGSPLGEHDYEDDCSCEVCEQEREEAKAEYAALDAEYLGSIRGRGW